MDIIKANNLEGVLNSESENEYDEEPLVSEKAECLLCSESYDAENIFEHCDEEHKTRIREWIKNHNPSEYDIIKLVNGIFAPYVKTRPI